VKTTIEEINETKRIIRVEVPAEVVDRKLDELYRRVARTIEVPGFRKGRVPRSFLEMRFGKDFLYEDTQTELIEEYLLKALEDLDVELATRPEARVIEFEAGKPFTFEVDVEVFPEVELADPAQIEIAAPPQRDVTEEDIERVMEELQRDHAVLVPKEGEDAVVEDEDVVVVRLPSGETHELQAHAEGFTAQLLGKRVGESVELTSGEGEDAKSVTVTIDGIKRIELPDLDELAQTLGHEGVEELRTDVRQRLEERLREEHEGALRLAALDALIERSRVVVPDKLIDEIVAGERAYLQQQGRDLPEEEIGELREAVRKRLQRDRVLRAFKQKEQITLSDREFEEFLKQEAERQGMNPVKFKALLEREGQLERLRRRREDEKALSALLQHVRICPQGEQS
jgi:trigger factor